MTSNERDLLLTRIDERVKNIDEKLQRDYKTLYGNGHPGLVSRVQTLETNWRWARWIAGLIAGLIAGIVTLVVNIVSKH